MYIMQTLYNKFVISDEIILDMVNLYDC